MSKYWLMSLFWLLPVVASAGEDLCPLLLFPKPAKLSKKVESTVVRLAKVRLREAFIEAGAGLLPPRSAVESLGDGPSFSTLDSITVTDGPPASGYPTAKISFLELRYHIEFLNSRLRDEGSVRYSVVEIPGFEDMGVWTIEHPTFIPDVNGVYDYASYNILRTRRAGLPTTYLQAPSDWPAARLAMHFAAVSVPRTIVQGQMAYSQPIVRPMLSSQICSAEGCFTEVRVRALYTHLVYPSGREGSILEEKFHNFTVHTKNGELQSVKEGMVNASPIPVFLVKSIEALAGKL